MGATGSKNGAPIAWGATVNRRGKRQKKEYDKARLKRLDAYLERQTNTLRAHIQKLQSKKLWNVEYDAVRQVGLGSPCDEGKKPENMNKNRYTNILPYDHSRVKINPDENEENCSYINASFMDGFNRPNAYIAAQGPVPTSFSDFWQMVWEQESEVVLMVTNEVEGNKLKCHRYWPEHTQVAIYGNFEIECREETATTSHIKRLFMVQNVVTKETRRIAHLQFILWPDHGVPKSANEILSFRDEIYRNCDVTTSNAPIVIHCSAGVGRTGTYIALDRLICMAETLEQDLNVEEVVKDLRKNRCFMVQTLIQYGFVYVSLLEALMKGHKEVKKALSKLAKIDAEAKVAEETEDLVAEITAAREEMDGIEDDTIESGVAMLREKAGSTGLSRSNTQRMSTMLQGEIKEAPESNATEEAADVPSLSQRIKSYHAKNDEYRDQLQKAEKAWMANDTYLSAAQLTPIESRKASIQAQKEAYALRGEIYRKQVRDASIGQIEALQARMQNLEDSWARVLSNKHSSMTESERELASKLPLGERMNALRVSNAKGSVMGKVLVSEEEIREQRRVREEAEAAERRRKEEERIERERIEEEERRKAEEEKNREPERDTHENVVKEKADQSFVALRQAPDKGEKVHPMVAAMAGKTHKK